MRSGSYSFRPSSHSHYATRTRLGWTPTRWRVAIYRAVAGKRVLVVDDDPDIRELLFTALEDEGFEVVPAGNGQEALAIIKTFRPDVIVLDLMMPVMDGWQFAAELRNREEDIPIVLLSAARDLRTHAKALSAAEIIEKPFDLSELLPKIARVASAA